VLVYETAWKKCGFGQARDGNMTQYICFACCVTNALDTHNM